MQANKPRYDLANIFGTACAAKMVEALGEDETNNIADAITMAEQVARNVMRHNVNMLAALNAARNAASLWRGVAIALALLCIAVGAQQ